MCVLPYGHNLNALVLFGKALSHHFDEVICLASERLSPTADQAPQVERVLYYPYGGFVSAARPAKGRWRAIGRSLALVGKWLKRAVYVGSISALGYDFANARSERNWHQLFERYSIGADDTIIFPSSDFYGCTALLSHVRRLPAERRPRIHMRLIGTMEGAAYRIGPSRPMFFSILRRALGEGLRLTVSAETTVYAEYVERIMGAKVIYLPYPLVSSPVPLAWGHTKRVACPGQGRDDKGFFRIYPIVSSLARLGVHQQFAFDVQDMRTDDRRFRRRYQSQLQHTPNLELRPAQLAQSEIDAAYGAADILMLPYDPVVYAMRGSAVYQEGLAFGRLTLCSANTGVADMVQRYGNGAVAGSDLDFALKLRELSLLDKHVAEAMVQRAREAYEADFRSGLALALGAVE